MNKIFEAPVVPTIIKLAVISLLVGVVLYLADIDPLSLWTNFGETVIEIWDMTISFFKWAAKYMALGAIVVVPIWLFFRLLKVASARRTPPEANSG
jgi:Family of unknown function (DUF6460)